MTNPHVRTGDTVQVLTGVDRGKKGKVQQVFSRDQRAVIEGVNLRTRHLRPRRANQKGEIIHFNAPVALSNLLLVCPHCHKSTRIGNTRDAATGRRIRQCKKCLQLIDKA